MNSPAFTLYTTFDKSWTDGKPYCFDQVWLKAEVGLVLKKFRYFALKYFLSYTSKAWLTSKLLVQLLELGGQLPPAHWLRACVRINAVNSVRRVALQRRCTGDFTRSDVICRTFSNVGATCAGHRSSSDSPVHSNASTLSSNDGRVSDKANTSPQSSGQWKAQMKVTTFDPKKIKQPNKNSSNNNNNSTSHYQVPTHRYQGIAAMAGHDFSSSAPNPVRPSSHEPMRMSYSVKNKYGVKKTALWTLNSERKPFVNSEARLSVLRPLNLRSPGHPSCCNFIRLTFTDLVFCLKSFMCC